jgi:CheY-like chemotaxis protein
MYNILVIDDQYDVSDVLQQMLSSFGNHAEVASGGHEGIRMFDTGLFDVVITDILMPGIDGHDVVRHIRNSARPFTPIIGVSGTPWLLEGSDFDRVIAKPFGLQILRDAVNEVMATPVLHLREGYTTAMSA